MSKHEQEKQTAMAMSYGDELTERSPYMEEIPTSKRKTPSWTSITLCGAIAAASAVTIGNTILELTEIQEAFLTVAIAALLLSILSQIGGFV